MIAESNCTVYKFNGTGFDRYYIPACHWQENKARNVLKSGDQNADSVTVYIPLGSITAENVPETAAKDIIVEGECNFTFDNSNEQTASQSLKKLRATCKIHTVMSVDRKLYGSKNLQHVKISAR